MQKEWNTPSRNAWSLLPRKQLLDFYSQNRGRPLLILNLHGASGGNDDSFWNFLLQSSLLVGRQAGSEPLQPRP